MGYFEKISENVEEGEKQLKRERKLQLKKAEETAYFDARLEAAKVRGKIKAAKGTLGEQLSKELIGFMTKPAPTKKRSARREKDPAKGWLY